jgi:hypothetical protein
MAAVRQRQLGGQFGEFGLSAGVLKLDVAEPQRPAPISILLTYFHATKIQ